MDPNGRPEFEALVTAWAKAIVANDPDAIGEFAEPDWVLIGENGVLTRERFLESVRSGRITHDMMAFELLDVRRYGDVAVVIARGQNTGTFDGEAFAFDEWITDVFVRRGDDWKCTVTHLTSAVDRPGESDANC